MLWKKYHRNYVKKFKVGGKFKLSYYKRDSDTFAVEKVTEELQVLKKPYIDSNQEICINTLGDISFPFVIIHSNGIIRWKEPIQIY